MPSKVRKHSIYVMIIVLLLGGMACGAVSTATEAPAQNAVPATVAPAVEATATEVPPTKVPPTATEPPPAPDANLQGVLAEMADKGYINSTEGTFTPYEDFKEEWAQLNWYQYWPIQDKVKDFVFNAHFSWSTASATPEDSGCGVVFGLQSNDDHYAVILTNSRILFMRAAQSLGNYAREVGKTKGTGRVKFGNPAEADFTLAVSGKSAYTYVDQQFIGQYALSNDQLSEGTVALTLLSGTNKDFGTRCEMTNVGVLTIQ